VVTRCGSVEQDVTLFTSAELPPGCVQVPGGLFQAGGDPDFPLYPARTQRIDEFFLALDPVTCAEYADFLNALAKSNLPLAKDISPSSQSDRRDWPGPPFEVPTSSWLVAASSERRSAASRLANCPVDWEADWPVLGVTWRAAMDYAAWRRESSAWPFTLPEESCWEKAARGPDGRYFPFGRHFDARWCNVAMSRDGAPRPVSVHAFPHDESPYGVRGLAGNAKDWALNPAGGPGRMWRIVRGGYWSTEGIEMRVVYRSAGNQDGTHSEGSFRLACPIRLPWT
jgi:serine/threonine-protein kinase